MDLAHPALQMNTTSILTLVLAGMICVGCGPDSSDQTYHFPDYTPTTYPGYPGTQTIPPAPLYDYRPDVNVRCASGDCPQGVGVLLISGLAIDGQTKLINTYLGRCTATLVNDHQVLANSHCKADLLTVDSATFYVNSADGSKTLARDLETKATVDMFTSDLLFPEDLAVWNLSQPLTGVQARTVSRRIPADMSTMVAYVSNADEAADKTDPLHYHFVIEKRTCSTQEHVSVMDWGRADDNWKVALFGCEIRHGNSGSPVFAAGDFSTIQLVLSAIANDQGLQNLGVKYAPYLTGAPPPYLTGFFAASERLQCLPLTGWPTPEHLCSGRRRESVEYATLVRSKMEEFYRQPSSGRVLWGLRAVAAELSEKSDPKKGVLLLPYAICAQHGRQASAPVPSIVTLQLGESPEGTFEQHELPSSIKLEQTLTTANGQWQEKLKFSNSHRDVVAKDALELLTRSTILSECQVDDLARDRVEALAALPAAFSEINAVPDRIGENSNAVH
jgi:hypothetical protein